MSPRLLIPTLAITLALGAGVAAPAAAGSVRQASVGSEGELYFVHEGAYGELFPTQGLADPENRVLALDVTRADGTSDRFLVPETGTADLEDNASILFEDQTGTLFVLWHAKINVIHSCLNLIGFRNSEWTDPVEISGNPFGWKSSPQLAITRDTFQTEEDDGSLRVWQRTVVHLLWWETGSHGEPQVQYSPVVLLDGVYTGWNPVYRMDELLQVAEGPPLQQLNLALAQVPRIESGRNNQSVVIGLVDPVSGDLTTFSLEVLPGEFGVLADRVRHQISEIGRSLLPDQPAALAEKVRHQISEIGNKLGLHQSVTSYIAARAYEETASASAGDDPAVLADRVRHQISEIGARITDRGLGRIAAKDGLGILELPNLNASERVGTHFINVVRATARPAPATGTEGLTLHLSRSGRQALVAWIQDGSIQYVESRGDGWSEPHRLGWGQGLDVESARRILDQRADERTIE